MSNPMMSNARILRPYQGFEYYYGLQGAVVPTPGDQPIRLQPVNPTLILPRAVPPVDPFAYDQAARQGIAGYSPRLGAMLPMSALGSMVMVYLPQIPHVNEAISSATFAYAFVPVWRMRTPADWRRFKKQGNIPLERFGAPDTTVGADGDRYIIPAARGAAIYARPEPVTATLAPNNLAVQIAYPEAIGMISSSTAASWRHPIAPNAGGGVAMFTQQGVVDAAVGGGDGAQPFYRPHWIRVCGNELAFDVYKINIPEDGVIPNGAEVSYRNWDFEYDAATGYCDTVAPGEDLPFSMVFGCGADPGVQPTLSGDHLNSGAYVFTGTD